MKSQLRICVLTLCVLAPATAGLHAQGRPITLSDGSVCLSDMGQPLPDAASEEHQRPFKVSTVLLERLGKLSEDMKGCMPLVTKCAECEEFTGEVKSVVVLFREPNNMRNIALEFDGATVRFNTGDLRFGDWQPHGNASDRKKVKRDGGKIQWIFVDGRPFDCRKSFCRITIQNDDSAQAQ